MAVPSSFTRDGFVSLEQARRKPGTKFRRLMIATEGRADTGKTEFILSCPGPGLGVIVDRGFDGVADNPKPPPTRRSDFAFKLVQASAPSMATQDKWIEQWKTFYVAVRSALANTDALTVAIDGDSDSWELQRLAEHGKLTGVFPATRYTDVKAKRRGFYYEWWDSGKIIIATNKLKEEWADILDAHGNPIKDTSGENKRESTGNYIAQGFPDQEYLWQIRIRHLFKPASYNTVLKRDIPKQWGLKVLRSKANMDVVGQELWGEDATFTGLVQLVYPQIPLTEWGLK